MGYDSILGMVGQRAREDVLYLNSDLWYNWPRFDRSSEVLGARAKVQRMLRTGRVWLLVARKLLARYGSGNLVSQAGNL